MKLTFKITIVLTIILFTITGCISYKYSEKDLFRPRKENPISHLYTFDQYLVNTPDGIKLEGWHLSQNDAKINFVFFSGRSGKIRYAIPFFNMIGENIKANIFSINYRGYGLSEGNPTIDGVIEDGKSAINYFLKEKDLNKGLPTYIIGISFGTFISLNVMDIDAIKGCILISTFTSTTEAIETLKKTIIPFYLSPFVKIDIDKNIYKLDNLSLIRKIKKPIILFNGSEDSETPYQMSEKLYNETPSDKKRIILINGAEHNSIILEDRYSEEVVVEIIKFLTEVVGEKEIVK